jgi:hypothetical protein
VAEDVKGSGDKMIKPEHIKWHLLILTGFIIAQQVQFMCYHEWYPEMHVCAKEAGYDE